MYKKGELMVILIGLITSILMAVFFALLAKVMTK